MKFQHLIMEKSIQSNYQKWPPKGIFCQFIAELFMYEADEDACEIVFIISSSTDYEFSAAIYIFKALMRSVYYYKMFADIERRQKYKRLVAYGFHS